MSNIYIKDKTYTNIHVSETPLETGGYESCTFVNCNFSNADFSGFIFSECEFEGCNLSLVKLQKTSLRDVIFKDCKLSGIQFENTNEFGLSFGFIHCIIHNASFFNMHIRNTQFKNCESYLCIHIISCCIFRLFWSFRCCRRYNGSSAPRPWSAGPGRMPHTVSGTRFPARISHIRKRKNRVP